MVGQKKQVEKKPTKIIIIIIYSLATLRLEHALLG